MRSAMSLLRQAVSDESFFALRDRAYELANSKHYKRWDQIAYALKAEGFLPALIMRFNKDTQAVMMITHCCTLARQS
jgi:hypothetical protein